ncbi:DUF6262 family protein [Arthrobacter subterraneus]|uniref:DUF6262 family protein n=1 Tax=Arthrobacter subterraneus TaxID=335973 RepID=UPI003818EC49
MITTLNQIERACTELAHDGQPVTFTAVAEHTGLARSTLYRNQALRAVIEQHRRTAPEGPIPAITDELATLRATVRALADTGRRHDTQIRRLARG